MDDTQSQLQAIHERNRRVEVEKAWEISFTRRAVIALITYLTATLFLWLVGVPFFFLHALVPTGGYILSTLSLPWVKKRWMKQFH
jgi:hypothetical protein